MNRRQLLQLAAALASSTVLPAAGNGPAPAALFRDPEMLAVLGSRCAAQLPTAPEALAALAGLGRGGSNRTQLQGFAARRAADFRAGHIVTVDGWVLARSEAALCALIARS